MSSVEVNGVDKPKSVVAPILKYEHPTLEISAFTALTGHMDKPTVIHIDYDSHPDLPSRSTLLDGEKPLSPLGATVAMLIGLGVIMAVVTVCIVRG